MMTVDRALYLPACGDFDGGLYFTDFQSVPTAITRRGKSIRNSAAPPKRLQSLNLNSVPVSKAPNGFLYCGELHRHYGHFVLESLSRLWPVTHNLDFLERIPVFIARGSVTAICQQRFATATLTALDINSELISDLKEPCILENVIVPSPSFEIRLRAANNFFSMMGQIGETILSGRTIEPASQPLYLSKSRLTHGLSRIFNEDEIDHELRARGVDVVYPEQMAFVDQVHAIATHNTICGSAGSAFHTMLFTKGVKTVRGVVLGDVINSNYLIIDKGLKNHAEYISAAEIGLRLMRPDELPKGCSVARNFYCHDIYKYCDWITRRRTYGVSQAKTEACK